MLNLEVLLLDLIVTLILLAIRLNHQFHSLIGHLHDFSLAVSVVPRNLVYEIEIDADTYHIEQW